MRLAKFIIRRFKGIEELQCTVPFYDPTRKGSAEFLTILGENNRCKSSVLEALRLAFPNTDIKKPSRDHFPNRNYNNGPIEIELHFDRLGTEEKEKHGLRAHIFRDTEYRIRKRWTAKEQKKEKDKRSRNTNEDVKQDEDGEVKVVLEIEALTEIIQVPSDLKAYIMENGFNSVNATFPAWGTVIDGFLAAQPEAEVGRKRKVSVARFDSFQEYASTNHLDLCEKTEIWQSNPGGISANPDSAMPHLIFLPAQKDVNKEADPSNTNSTAQKLLALMFAQRLASDHRLVGYQDAVRSLESIFDQNEQASPLKTIQRDISSKLEKLIKLEIELQFIAPRIDSLFQSTTMMISDHGIKTSLHHQGHGAQRALLLTLLELYAKQLQDGKEGEKDSRGCLILCEEPEIYLHPQMCRRMRDVLVELARTETAQVICTTHSPIFLDLADRHDGIIILSKDEQTKKLIKRPAYVSRFDKDQHEPERLRMLLDFDPNVNELFFARRVILVEGDSELAAYMAMISVIARRERKPDREIQNKLREISIVNCRGKDTIPAIQRVLNAFEIEYCVIHDQDKDENKTNSKIYSLIENHRETRLLVHDKNFERAIMRKTLHRTKPWAVYQWVMTKGETGWPALLLQFFKFIIGDSLYRSLSLPEPGARTVAREPSQTQMTLEISTVLRSNDRPVSP